MVNGQWVCALVAGQEERAYSHQDRVCSASRGIRPTMDCRMQGAIQPTWDTQTPGQAQECARPVCVEGGGRSRLDTSTGRGFGLLFWLLWD